jgi:predicted enzyme related to lactoylglutathione lyase
VGFTETFAGIAVRDRARAIEFYERLLGKPPFMYPNDDEAAWQVTEGGWLYVVHDLERAGSSLATLLVDDLDADLERWAQAGIAVSAVEDIPGAVRIAEILDPDGNRIQVGQPATRSA